MVSDTMQMCWGHLQLLQPLRDCDLALSLLVHSPEPRQVQHLPLLLPALPLAVQVLALLALLLLQVALLLPALLRLALVLQLALLLHLGHLFVLSPRRCRCTD